ncbi:MAG: general secretion pathway protein GspK [Gemmataceae bacterium]
MRIPAQIPTDQRAGYVLIAVLLVVVVLSLSAYRFAESMSSEYIATLRATENTQTKAYAVSGVHYAMGMLADPTTRTSTLGNNPYDNSNLFSNVSIESGGKRGGGFFSLLNIDDNGGGASGSSDSRYTLRYGVSDESGKVNINALIRLDSTGEILHGILIKLPNMTEEIADAIVDWVDGDEDVRANGAEGSSYAQYSVKNAPLSSLDELLLVRGVTPELLYGNDRNRNGTLDQDESQEAALNRGWSDYLTVYGRELNIDSTGAPRIYLNDTKISELHSKLVEVIGQDMADYAVAYRMYSTQAAGTASTINRPRRTGTITDLQTAVQASLANPQPRRTVRNSITSLYNTQVILPRAPNAPPTEPEVVIPCPLNDRSYFTKALPNLLDKTTSKSAYELNPRLNVNTAPMDVLMAVSGVSQDEITNALAIRQSLTPGTPEYTTGAWLVTQAGMRPDIFQNVERLLTGYTQTYRVQSIGYFGKGGPVARVEAVIDTNSGYPRILYFRDLTDLGASFTPPR